MRRSEETDDNVFAYFDKGGLTATDGIFFAVRLNSDGH